MVAAVLAAFVPVIEYVGSPGPGLHIYSVAGGATAVALALAAWAGRHAHGELANGVAVAGGLVASVLAMLTDTERAVGGVLRPAEVLPMLVVAVIVARPLLVAALAASTWLAFATVFWGDPELPGHLVLLAAAGALAVALAFGLHRGRVAAAGQARLEAERAHLARQREAVTRFVRHAAHQMRTPLTPLRLMPAVWRGRLDAPGAREMLDQLERNVVRLGTVVDSLVALAAAEEGTGEAQSDIMQAVRAVADDPRVAVEGPDRASVALGADGTAAIADVLVRNGLEAARRVRVRVRADGAMWVLDVEDDGPGIPPAERALLREPFGRVGAQAHIEPDRPGVGLALVDAIAAAAGGTLELLDSDLGGLLARVRLPAVR